MEDYLIVNRANWDERAPAHAASKEYALESFIQDPSFLSEVVAFDRRLLGDVRGLDGVHLQCHIGTDTISLARLGARMTGVDFSAASFGEARRLAGLTGAPVRFVESDVYRALDVLPADSFDLVYTGVGALCWLPDISGWAQVVAGLLRPGGRLFVRDGHPMLLSVDEAHTDRLVIDYPYFERPEPLAFDDGAPTSRPTSRSLPPGLLRGTTGSARRSPRCLMPACRSPDWPSTTACRGRRCRGR